MAEDKMNKTIEDITGIVDNMGKIVVNANMILAQLSESMGEAGASMSVLGQDMAKILPNITEIISAYDSVKNAVSVVTEAMGKAFGVIDNLQKSLKKVPDTFSGIGEEIKKIELPVVELENVIKEDKQPIELPDMIPQERQPLLALPDKSMQGEMQLPLALPDKSMQEEMQLPMVLPDKSMQEEMQLPMVLPDTNDAESKLQSVTAKLSETGGEIGNWRSTMGSAFDGVLTKVASFSLGFLKFMGIGAGVGLALAGLGLLQQGFGDQISSLINMAMTQGPTILENLCTAITQALPILIEQGAVLLNSLMEAIIVNLPILIEGAFSILSALIEGLAAQLPMLVPTAIQLILTLVQGLLDNLPMLIESGLSLITGLSQGLINAIPLIVAAIPSLIQSLLTGLLSMIPQIILTGIQLIGQLAVGLISAIPDILAAIPQIIDAVKNSFTSIDWGEVGSDIVDGIKNGLKAAAHKLLEVAGKVAEDALNWVKDKLGINSPSRVFRDEVGKMMALGMGIGFQSNIPIKGMKKGLGEAVRSLQGQAHLAVSSFGSGIVYSKSSIVNREKDQGFDFDEFERRQRRLNNEQKDRPVFLNGRQVNRALRKGVPVTV